MTADDNDIQLARQLSRLEEVTNQLKEVVSAVSGALTQNEERSNERYIKTSNSITALETKYMILSGIIMLVIAAIIGMAFKVIS